MPATRTFGILLFALAAGCTGDKQAPASISVSPQAIGQPQKHEAPPAVAGNPGPPLDVATLQARLRDTHAIGVFTKLVIKNQVDGLLKQFRSHYQGGQQTGAAALRQPYDMLILKMLALVQDGDPSLARTVSGSSEAIWDSLADPERFNAATRPLS